MQKSSQQPLSYVWGEDPDHILLPRRWVNYLVDLRLWVKSFVGDRIPAFVGSLVDVTLGLEISLCGLSG